jgi:Mn-dependent DtxR family transcriptional regulator
MAEPASEELKQKVLDYLDTVDKAKGRDVAKAIDVPKREVDQAINDLANDDKVEFLYLGTSYVTLKGKGGQAAPAP